MRDKNYFYYHGRLPSLNEYINQCRIHAQKGAKFKREWQEKVEYEILYAINKKSLYKPNKAVVLHFGYIEKTAKRDVDNIIGFAHKIIIDGLVQMGILENDTQKYVKGITDEFYLGDKELIKVEIEEIE